MWELLSFIQGENRRLALEELSKGPKTPKQIADSTEKHLSHMSRALRELEDKGVAKCMTPDANKNRFYDITEKGEKLLDKLQEIED